MTCPIITPARFKELKPQFAGVDNVVVQSYIELGRIWVSDDWPGQTCEAAQTSIICHLMTLDGLGTDAQSVGYKSGAANYQSIRSGELTLTRYQRAAGYMSHIEWLMQTQCGALFAQLLRMVRGGPRVAMGGIMPCVSGYAKDWPTGTGAYKDGPLE